MKIYFFSKDIFFFSETLFNNEIKVSSTKNLLRIDIKISIYLYPKTFIIDVEGVAHSGIHGCVRHYIPHKLSIQGLTAGGLPVQLEPATQAHYPSSDESGLLRWLLKIKTNYSSWKIYGKVLCSWIKGKVKSLSVLFKDK